MFNSNASLIGHINDNELRKQLVKTYTLAKGLIDTYSMNNELVLKYEQWNFMARTSQDPTHTLFVQILHDQLINYALAIKDSHQITQIAVDSLLKKLKEHL